MQNRRDRQAYRKIDAASWVYPIKLVEHPAFRWQGTNQARGRVAHHNRTRRRRTAQFSINATLFTEIQKIIQWFSTARIKIEYKSWTKVQEFQQMRVNLQLLINLLTGNALLDPLTETERQQLRDYGERLRKILFQVDTAQRKLSRQPRLLLRSERELLDSILALLMELVNTIYPLQNEFDWRANETVPEDFYFG
jgi:hypothetical protein